MNRHAMLALVPLLLATPMAAQTPIRVVGGFVSATFSEEIDGVDNSDEIGNRAGFAVGLGLAHDLGGGLQFTPEALYAVKGGKDPDSDDNLKFAYLEVPLLFRYSFATSGTATPYLIAGPTVAYLLSCDLGGSVSESCDDAFGEDDSYESLDFGLMGGVGVKFDRIGVSARYELGLKNIDKADGFVVRNRALFLLADVSF